MQPVAANWELPLRGNVCLGPMGCLAWDQWDVGGELVKEFVATFSPAPGVKRGHQAGWRT